MENNKRDQSILQHIINYCNDIAELVDRFGNDIKIFESDKAYRNACAMCILQIGELGGKLSSEFRMEYNQMPWSAIKTTRNVMAHDYGNINIQATWETICGDIPDLKKFCQDALTEALSQEKTLEKQSQQQGMKFL